VREVAEAIRDAGGQAWSAACDVADEASVAALAEAAGEHLGRVDILINNAGIATSSPLHRQSLEEWNRVLAVNLTGTFLCTRAFVPGMVERGWGRVVNIASVAARTGARYISAYASSKHGVLGLTRCVAAEVARNGVTVNAVCPGYVNTPMTENAVERIMSRTGMGRQEALGAILATSPQNRLVEPEEVAHVVLMLCDEAGCGINGQAIGIDGGEVLA